MPTETNHLDAVTLILSDKHTTRFNIQLDPAANNLIKNNGRTGFNVPSQVDPAEKYRDARLLFINCFCIPVWLPESTSCCLL